MKKMAKNLLMFLAFWAKTGCLRRRGFVDVHNTAGNFAAD
jgi:hypothetical protein